MEILELRALRGPNYYHQRPVIFMKLDIGELEERPTDTLPNCKRTLHEMMPTLYEHTCSPGVVGGFYQRVERGTWPGHVVEHIAIELQCLLGHRVTFGKTYTMKEKGIYQLVYRYLNEEVGLRAGELAVQIVEDLYRNEPSDIEKILYELKNLEKESKFGPSTQSIVDEALKRKIPVTRLNQYNYVQFGYGKNQRRIEATLMDDTSALGVEIAANKGRTKEILNQHGIPVAEGETVSNIDQAIKLANRIGYPLVVKPLDGNHGRGVTTNIQTQLDLVQAFKLANELSKRVVVEEYISGNDYRILVINGQFVACALRKPAQIIGDGKSTIKELVDQLNLDPRRGEGHEEVMTRVSINRETERLLRKQGYSLQSIPGVGVEIILKSTANMSSGGTAIDITDDVHPHNQTLAERIARIVGLNVMGIDVIAPSLEKPLIKGEGAVVEVNAGPGFRMHLAPSYGKARNAGKAVMDMLFPIGKESRIPICAVTGTNGKTTTARLIAHVLKQVGNIVGLTSTDEVSIDGVPILKGDYSGPAGAQSVLSDPSVDHAVLEVARGGILRRGLAFDWCDVGLLLNISNDHLGIGGIETVEDLARLKGSVTSSVKKAGYAIFNADDPVVMTQVDKTKGQVILFSMDDKHPELNENLKKGNLNITVKRNQILIQRPHGTQELLDYTELPITYNGSAIFNVKNVIAAVAACLALGVNEEQICSGLRSFNPSIPQSHGRMNVMDIADFKVMIDYGHNPDAIHETGPFLKNLTPGRTIRHGFGAGNRRDQDLIELGAAYAPYYDHVVISDPDNRKRTPGETAHLIKKGCLQAGLKENQVEIIEDELQAAKTCLEMAKGGDLVLLQADNIQEMIRFVLKYKEDL